MKIRSIIAAIAFAFTAGCATNESSQSNYYTADEANQQLKSELVTVLVVMPARLEVDNTRNADNAKKAGALLGALAGAYLGSQHDDIGGGLVAGGVSGAVGGSIVSSTKIIDGVSVTYQMDDEHFTAIQSGKVCQFTVNAKTLLITGQDGKTRIQPNAKCPVEK